MELVQPYKAWDTAEIAHELASPLTAMTMQLESLVTQLKCCEHCQKYVPTALSPSLAHIQETHQFLRSYLHNETQLGLANIQLLSSSVVDLLTPMSTNIRVNLIYKRQQALWWKISPYFFRQLLLNILNNALETYQQRSNLHNRQIVLTTKIWQQQLIVKVEDRAGGFGTQPKTNGHGIGLRNVEAYVQRSNGQIAITSREGVGTTVCCVFSQL